jgi:NAD(P)-dependent dehydrogenase (short-subunit alcohol dehydrogenase family)
MDRLKGKVALISGAARGQGAAEARLFASEGTKVVLGDVRDELLKQTADAIPGRRGSVPAAALSRRSAGSARAPRSISHFRAQVFQRPWAHLLTQAGARGCLAEPTLPGSAGSR